MQSTLLIATHNIHKAKEIQAKLKDYDVKVLTLKDVLDDAEIPEDFATFEENAAHKAMQAFLRHRVPVLADDSGLCVEALDGAPGVRSRRFSVEGTDEANNGLLLRKMQGQSNRKACFVCVLAYVNEIGQMRMYRGELHGSIALKPCGSGGFGYDPLFILEGSDKHLAQLDLETKNQVSHRAKAIEAWRSEWRTS